MKFKNHFLFIIVFSSISFGLKAEMLPTSPITVLSTRCQNIVLAKSLKKEGELHYFLSKNIFSNGEFIDTICLKNLERWFEGSCRKGPTFSNAEEVLFFICSEENGISNPCLSGYRLLKEDRIWYPYQLNNPGGYCFLSSPEELTWQGLIQNVQNVKNRIDSVLEMKEIPNDTIRNQKFIKWIEQNKHDFFRYDCGIHKDCGWGHLDSKVFKWITEAGIQEDTWNLSFIFREERSRAYESFNKQPFRGFMIDYGSSFSSERGLNFLMEKIENPNSSPFEKQQALFFLRNSLKFVFKGNENGRVDSLTEMKIQLQNQLLNQLMPLLNEEKMQTKRTVFESIKYLCQPGDGNYFHRKNLENLPQIINHYKAEPPSEYRHSLASFIVRNVDEREWKNLQGSDAKMFLTARQPYFDSTRMEIQFHLNYKNGKEKITKIPMVRFDKMEGEIVVRSVLLEPEEKSYFPLPFENWNGSRVLFINVQELPKGVYSLRAFGEVGNENQYYWESEPVLVELK